jgi:hypothetical protein
VAEVDWGRNYETNQICPRGMEDLRRWRKDSDGLSGHVCSLLFSLHLHPMQLPILRSRTTLGQGEVMMNSELRGGGYSERGRDLKRRWQTLQIMPLPSCISTLATPRAQLHPHSFCLQSLPSDCSCSIIWICIGGKLNWHNTWVRV